MHRALVALLALAALVGCNDRTRQAMGDEHSVIVVAADSLWLAVEDTVLNTLQPRVFAVRDEATFRVSHISPGDPYWGDLRRFRQILAVGRADDPWVGEPLGRGGVDPSVPGIYEVDNVWARNQRVTVLLLPETDGAAAVEARVDTVASLLDRRYRQWTVQRMFTSGLNVEARDRLAREEGFTLDVPNVYRWREVADSVYLFLNDQPDASQLVRSLLVTWRPLTGPASGETAGDTAAAPILEWREAVAERYYDWGQEIEPDRLQVRPVRAPGAGGTEVRGVWYGTIEGFPQAGLFISRAVDCPTQGRRYLLDAWLYAPARAKYQYIIQLETILDSFECQVE
jgi:hypothetical protein